MEKQWLKINDDDGGTYLYPAVIKTKKQLDAEYMELVKRLAEIPPSPSDKELLAWAKDNFPFLDRQKERDTLQKLIDEVDSILSING